MFSSFSGNTGLVGAEPPRRAGMTTVVIADDHTAIRASLRAWLQSDPGLRFVGEATDGHEAVQAVERLTPDVLVVDLIMPGLSGFEVARWVTEHCPKTRIIVFSAHDSEAYVSEALRSGASGFAVKDAGAARLLEGIRRVADGELYLSPLLAERSTRAHDQSLE